MGSGKKRKNKCNNVDTINMDSDDNFVFIAGYTSWGIPYGITWEEMEKIKQEELPETIASEDDMELPFD